METTLQRSYFSLVLIPWSKDHGNMIVAQLVKKFPHFYGTQGFITMFPGPCPDPD